VRNCDQKGTLNALAVARIVADESAAAAIEYGLIATGIAATAIGAFQMLGGKLGGTFSSLADNLGSGQSGSELGHHSTQP
jgi:pilus assembly protein Flp/PilA